MPEFSNQYNATIDDKGRVVLPSAYKRELGEALNWTMVVELDPYEMCLNLYPSSSWEKRIESITSKLNPNNQGHSKFLDRFYQNFVKISVAENGRINIPNTFLTQKSLVKDVVFSGQGSRIRLWNTEEFNKAMLPDEEFKGLFEDLLGGN
jgi:MraZ protein